MSVVGVDPLDADLEDESEAISVDPWAGLLPGRTFVPAYLVSSYAAQYRTIVDVLLAALDRSLTGMAFDEVVTAVRARLSEALGPDRAESLTASDVFLAEARLDRLVQWGVVTRWQEPARTGEDFLRRRDRYQLTSRAARLHAFWSESEDGDQESADVTLAPRAICERLSAFKEAIEGRLYVDAAREFQQVIALHQAMARAARGWQRSLAQNLSGPPEQVKQDVVSDTLRSYVAMWGEQVDVNSPLIARLMDDLAPVLTSQVWDACVRAALPERAEEHLVEGQARRWRGTWDTLGAWFGSASGQARRLRRQLRDVVAPWARNQGILMDTSGAVTRRAEAIRLAVTLERADDDAQAWRLFDTAMGAFSCRHLLLETDSPDRADLPWAEAPAAPVTARFRQQGPRSLTGRRFRPPDYRLGREQARRQRLAEKAAERDAEARMRQRSGSHLSEWGHLDRVELTLLLDLLTAARRAGPVQSGLSKDGRWQVRFDPPADAGDVAVLAGPDGSLFTADWRFSMEPAD